MKNNYIKKAMLATGLLLAGSFYHTNLSKDNNPENKVTQKLERIIEREKIFNQRIQEQSSDEIEAPQYKTKGSLCSRYARKSTEDLFGKKYFWRNAWDLRYNDKIAHTFNEKQGEKLEKELKELIIDGVLTPGSLIGIKQPDDQTACENEIDETGKKAKYTHVVLYVGLNDSGEAEFIHQFGRKMEKITEKDFEKKKFIPIEILTTKEDNVYLAFLGKLLDNQNL